MPSRAWFFFALAVMAVSIHAACGGGDQATTSASGGGRPSGSGGTGGLCFMCGTGGMGGSAALGCSPDLHAVLDANGQVVKTCPPDQGCANGQCIEACAAADASHGNVGCDFLVPTPPSYPADLPPCFAVFLTNTWPEDAKITVDRAGMMLDPTMFGFVPQNGMPEAQWPSVPSTGIPIDQVAVLFMSGDPAAIFGETGEPMKCPRPTAVNAATSLQASGIGTAFHIKSSAPISAYDILPYGGAHTHFPGATMLLPSTAWGKNYVYIATPVGTTPQPGPLWGEILASADNTNIQILPSVDLPALANYPAAPKGKNAAYTLNAGEYLHWQLAAGTGDMSGSVVLADKPVAAFAGNRFFRLQPMEAPGGETTHQQIAPVSALGSEYVGAPYATRRADLQPEAIPYRIVGTVDGTMLVFDPPIAGAPAKLDLATVADFTTDLAFRVKSQDADHPFAIAQVMPTANLVGGSRPGATAPMYPPNLGDEEFVGMLPPKQFLSKYAFFTDPTYPTTNLVLTRVKGPKGFADVTIDCLGVVGGWQAAGASGDYEVTNVDLLRAGVPTMSCANGRHTASSDQSFGLVVWGEDSYSSYAYPGGGTAAELTNVVVQPMPQ